MAMEKISVPRRGCRKAGQEVRLQGWVRTPPRLQGRLQLSRAQRRLVPGQHPNRRRRAHWPTTRARSNTSRPAASVTVEGKLRASPGKGQATEVQAQAITVHGWADPATYPLQKKRHSFEFLRTHRPPAAADQHLRRDRPRAELRQPLDPRFFPGAGLSLRPHADHHRQRLRRGRRDVQGDDARPGQSPRASDGEASTIAKDFFARPAYLTVSGQLQGEIFACALGKIYTFGPTFRAENSNTSRHLAEFWMVEPEMAFFELADNMDLAEAFLKRIFRDVLTQCADDMELFNEHIDNRADRHA